MTKPALPDGLVAFVKRDCPTCELVGDVLADIEARTGLTTYTQDDPAFPEAVNQRIDDTELSVSWHHDIETVPTLIRVENGAEVERIVGWSREQWEPFTGLEALGGGLPEWRPGCGSLSVDPNLANDLMVKFSGSEISSRRIVFAAQEDEFDSMFQRGWTDGLPVVPPTEARVLAMLNGTTRSPSEIVVVAPPDLVDCTVEKVAINAVMAGCKPEYLPVVLAAVEAVCNETFNMHGLLATTMPAGPVIVVNGEIRKRIGMNWSHNAMGQGNRANSTIGRALQLVIRNVGGGRPGEVDRATHGQPGKLGFCFAEDEEGSPWGPLNADLGGVAGEDAVTAFATCGTTLITDQLSREPESLCRSLAAGLLGMGNSKSVLGFDAMLVLGPEHASRFRDAGWSKEQLIERIVQLTERPGSELVRGAGGITEGIPAFMAEAENVPKVQPGGLMIAHAGSGAGLFSMLLPGWVSGEMGSQKTTVPIRP